MSTEEQFGAPQPQQPAQPAAPAQYAPQQPYAQPAQVQYVQYIAPDGQVYYQPVQYAPQPAQPAQAQPAAMQEQPAAPAQEQPAAPEQPAPAVPEQPEQPAAPAPAQPVQKTAPAPAQAVQPAPPLARYRWLAVSCCIVSWIALIVFLFGAISAYGETFTPLAVIRFLVGIGGVRAGNIYPPLAKAALAVVYIIFLVLIIKNLVGLMRRTVSLFSKKAGEQKPQRPAALTGMACEHTACLLMKVYTFMVLSAVFAEGAYTAGSWAMTVFGCLYLMVYALLTCLPRTARGADGKKVRSKESTNRFAFAMLRQALIAALLCCMAAFLVTPAFNELLFGIKVLFGGYYTGFSGFLQTFYSSVVRHAVNGVAAFLFLSLLGEALRSCNVATGYRREMDEMIRRRSLTILIMMGASAVLACFVSLVGAGGNVVFTPSTLGEWVRTLRVQLLPAVLTAGTGPIVACFMKDVGKLPAAPAKA